jgi:Ca2+-binding RTX toxin-like protein
MLQTEIKTVKKLRFLKNFAGLTLILVGFFSLSPTALGVGFCDSAVTVNINTVTTLRTLAPGARDYYRINAPSAGLLSLFTLGALDTVGQLYDKDCLAINGAFDDNNFESGYNNFNFLLSWPVVKAPYYLEVRGKYNTTQGNYKLQVDGDFASDDRGVSCSSATVVRSFVESGVLAPYGDRDFFQVKVAGGTGHLIVQTEGALDTVGQLYDRDCLAINGAFNDNNFNNGYNNFNFKIDKFLSPGIYFVEVRGKTAFDTKGNYNLRVIGDVSFPFGTCAGKAATLSGTNGNDVIKGTPGNDVIQAFGGTDVIFGLAGNDTICGGDGDDVVQGSDGLDLLFGEAGNDVLQGGDKNDALNGGTGTDLCDGGAQTDTATACEVTSLVP